jgi:ABC-type uncharacterized transport system fused permease/ATPase subunit
VDTNTTSRAVRRFSEDAIADALRLLDLGHLVARLDENEPWDQPLSVDEQQRLTLRAPSRTGPPG